MLKEKFAGRPKAWGTEAGSMVRIQSAVTSRLMREAFCWVEPSSNADKKARTVVSIRSRGVLEEDVEVMMRLNVESLQSEVEDEDSEVLRRAVSDFVFNVGYTTATHIYSTPNDDFSITR